MLIKQNLARKFLMTGSNILLSTHEDTNEELIIDDINYNETQSNEINLTSNKSEEILTNNLVTKKMIYIQLIRKQTKKGIHHQSFLNVTK